LLRTIAPVGLTRDKSPVRETGSTLTITDPQSIPAYPDGLISRWCRKALYEPGDEVFVRLTLRAIATQLTAMVVLWATLRYTQIPAIFPALAYLALWGWGAPPIILMLHCTMHRRFIRSPKWLDKAHPFVMPIFFGMPMGFREHHIGMHHVEDNMSEDLSSTLQYRRDSFLHFLHYFGKFFFFVGFELPLYLRRKRRFALARRAIFGELAQWSLIALAFTLFDWRFALTAFLLPLILCRVSMMAGNWGQHAFINTDLANGGLSNAITCINTTYNKRCFNDGYHIGHHVKAQRHWAELPGDFLANKEQYAREGAIVFEGIDFFMVSVLLWTKRWNVLAKRFVRIDRQLSDAEVIALLQSRVQPVRSWPAEELAAARA
jgi:fatty acid desaturase